MLDINLIRHQYQTVESALARRGGKFPLAEAQQLDCAVRELQQQHEQQLAKRNQLSRAVASRNKAKQPAKELIAEVQELKINLARVQQQLHDKQQQLASIMDELPNLPAAAVPAGASEADNREIYRKGTLPEFNFTVSDHVALGKQHDILDFTRAAKLSGARFVQLQGAVVQLQRALVDLMLRHNREFGYQELDIPLLVNQATMYAAGKLPKFADDCFATKDGYWLIPTAEIVLCGYASETIMATKDLPLRLMAHSQCFRREAGAAGQDTRGMIRQHQFNKVELVTIATPEQSEAEHQQMCDCAEALIEKLEIPYRKLDLCCGDLGFTAARTFDLELWLPSQQRYREVSSISNCTDYQMRRNQTRVRLPDSKRSQFCHCLNGTSLAVGRTLVAIMECNQTKTGNIKIPSVLQSTFGRDRLFAT